MGVCPWGSSFIPVVEQSLPSGCPTGCLSSHLLMGVWVSHLGVGAVTGQAAVKFHEKNKEKLKWFNEMGAYFSLTSPSAGEQSKAGPGGYSVVHHVAQGAASVTVFPSHPGGERGSGRQAAALLRAHPAALTPLPFMCVGRNVSLWLYLHPGGWEMSLSGWPCAPLKHGDSIVNWRKERMDIGDN